MTETCPRGASRTRLLLAAAAASCLLALLSQAASTPIGEGMDIDGHLAYVVFLLREGRPPVTGEPALPADVANLRRHGLASDYVSPGSYARWARLTPAEREKERKAWLTPDPAAPYVSDNYEAQHPPLYYLLAAAVDRPLRERPYDVQVFGMSVLAALLAAAAVPALYSLFRRYFQPGAALTLVTAVAWFPNLMPFLGRPTNDALAFPLACWLLWVIDRPEMRRRDIAAGAALLSAGLLTKTYFLTLVPAFLAVCLLRGGGASGAQAGRRRWSWRSLALGAGLLALGAAPLLAANYTTTGLMFPLYEARFTAAEPLWRKLSSPFTIDWVLFGVLMARGFFWSGYWSWVAPGPWFYVPLLAPLALWLPRPARSQGADSWWRATARRTWVHLIAWAGFLAGMWWHAGLMALRARAHGGQFMGAEGWYLNALVGSTAVVLAVAVRERYGPATAARVLRGSAVVLIGWNLIARATLIAFWGGGVRLWSGLRFAWLGDVVRALGDPAGWAAWHSWPGVVGPAWLTVAAPLGAALVLSGWVLAAARR
jgi:hypothetical protein